MSTRAEEVAEEVYEHCRNTQENFGSVGPWKSALETYFKSLPEFQPGRTIHDMLAIIHGDGGHYEEKHGFEKAFQDAEEKVSQPGRELTAKDLRECYPPGLYLDSHFAMIASNLNKIRAPITNDAAVIETQGDTIESLEKERDELKTLSDFHKMQADGWKSDCDELTAQLESVNHCLKIEQQLREPNWNERCDIEEKYNALNSQPSVGVTKDQVKAAIKSAGAECGYGEKAEAVLEKIADAISPRWIKVSDEYPKNGTKVYWFNNGMLF